MSDSKPAWLERLHYYEAQGFGEGKPGCDDKIVAWMRGPGGGKWVKSSRTPWCGGGLAGMLEECGLHDYIPKDPLGAINWLNLPTVLNGPRVGAIVVFPRSGGNHVTVVDSFDDKYLYCLGCNQGDPGFIKISTYKRKDAKGYRWPVPLVTPKDLAKTSRIAAAAERQRKDGQKAGGWTTTEVVHQTAPAPTPPAGWRESVDGTLADVSWIKSTLAYGADFGGFVGQYWWVIAGGMAAFYFCRMQWDAYQIRQARADDANQGWTT